APWLQYLILITKRPPRRALFVLYLGPEPALQKGSERHFKSVWRRSKNFGNSSEGVRTHSGNNANPLGLDFANDLIRNLRSGRGVDVDLSFLRLGRGGWRWIYHRGVSLFFFCGWVYHGGVTLFFLRRRICHSRFLLLAGREQHPGSKQINIFSHTNESHLRTTLAAFRDSIFFFCSQDVSNAAQAKILFVSGSAPRNTERRHLSRCAGIEINGCNDRVFRYFACGRFVIYSADANA